MGVGRWQSTITVNGEQTMGGGDGQRSLTDPRWLMLDIGCRRRDEWRNEATTGELDGGCGGHWMGGRMWGRRDGERHIDYLATRMRRVKYHSPRPQSAMPPSRIKLGDLSNIWLKRHERHQCLILCLTTFDPSLDRKVSLMMFGLPHGRSCLQCRHCCEMSVPQGRNPICDQT
jgi:hypothetical protein